MKGQERWGRQAVVFGRFTAGFLLSAVSVFAFAGAIGLAIRHVASTHVLASVDVVGLTAAIALDVYALRTAPWCPLSVRRQTPQAILYTFGLRRAALAWGLDTGLVFSTFRVSAVSWVVLLGCLTGAAPWWTGIAYAAGFVIPLSALSAISGVVASAEPDRLARGLHHRNTSARVLTVAILAASLAVLAANVW